MILEICQLLLHLTQIVHREFQDNLVRCNPLRRLSQEPESGKRSWRDPVVMADADDTFFSNCFPWFNLDNQSLKYYVTIESLPWEK